MPKVRRERSSACRHSEASRQPMGVLFRRLAFILTMERQSEGGGSMCSLRHDFPAFNTSLQDRVGAAGFVHFADSAGTLGAVIKLRTNVRRMRNALHIRPFPAPSLGTSVLSGNF